MCSTPAGLAEMMRTGLHRHSSRASVRSSLAKVLELAVSAGLPTVDLEGREILLANVDAGRSDPWTLLHSYAQQLAEHGVDTSVLDLPTDEAEELRDDSQHSEPEVKRFDWRGQWQQR